MTNQFFKNYGPFRIDKLLESSNIINKNNYKKLKVTNFWPQSLSPVSVGIVYPNFNFSFSKTFAE
jgi:hypothetical protein